MAHKLLSLCVTLITVSFIACGSPSDPLHGGHDDDTSPLQGAEVELNADPTSIGLGERTLIQITIQDINPDGALIVVRYPSERLRYVEQTSLLEVDGEFVSIEPVEGPLTTADNISYLVYFFTPASLAPEDFGVLSLHLQAERRVEQALIEVAQVLHNPLLEPSEEFSKKDPDFSADDLTYVEITQSNT